MTTIPVHPPFEQIEIQVVWTDRIGTGTKVFNNVYELAEFLKLNPVFAEALGYTVTKK